MNKNPIYAYVPFVVILEDMMPSVPPRRHHLLILLHLEVVLLPEEEGGGGDGGSRLLSLDNCFSLQRTTSRSGFTNRLALCLRRSAMDGFVFLPMN